MTEEKKQTITCMFGMQAEIGDKVLFGGLGQSRFHLRVGTVADFGSLVRIKGDQSGSITVRSPDEVFVLTNIIEDMPEYFV